MGIWLRFDGEDAEFYGTNNEFFCCGTSISGRQRRGDGAFGEQCYFNPPYSASVICGDYAYALTGGGVYLTCLALSNGTIQWSKDISDNGLGAEGSLIASDGKVIVLDGYGDLIVLANPSAGYNTNTYAPYQVTLPSGSRNCPALANGLMYCRDYGADSTGTTNSANLVCLNMGAGAGGVTNYTINASAVSNGSIVPSGTVIVPSGGNQTFTITPNVGCNITNVIVDGNSVGATNSYSFNDVLTNHTISAYFSATSITNFTISASAGPNGSIIPSGNVIVLSGSNQTFATAANTGYSITNVVADGSSVGATNHYAFNNVLANHTISAYFGSTSTNYTINASAGPNGSITPSGAVSVPSGSNQTFTIAVNTGYAISSVTVDGSSVGATNSYTFNNVTANHTINVLFSGSGPTGFSAWTNRMTVSFSGYNRSETLTNFPVLVVLSTNIPGFSYSQFASTNGYDLRFSASDGVTELNYEIEQWNPGGSSYVWVQAPQLSIGSYIWTYWGNAGAASGPASHAINGAAWPTNAFASVWHMGQTNALDSTANGNNGIALGSVTNAAGMIGGAQGVSGGGYVWVADSSSLEFAKRIGDDLRLGSFQYASELAMALSRRCPKGEPMGRSKPS